MLKNGYAGSSAYSEPLASGGTEKHSGRKGNRSHHVAGVADTVRRRLGQLHSRRRGILPVVEDVARYRLDVGLGAAIHPFRPFLGRRHHLQVRQRQSETPLTVIAFPCVRWSRSGRNSRLPNEQLPGSGGCHRPRFWRFRPRSTPRKSLPISRQPHAHPSWLARSRSRLLRFVAACTGP